MIFLLKLSNPCNTMMCLWSFQDGHKTNLGVGSFMTQLHIQMKLISLSFFTINLPSHQILLMCHRINANETQIKPPRLAQSGQILAHSVRIPKPWYRQTKCTLLFLKIYSAPYEPFINLS